MEKSDRRVRELGPALNSIIDRVFGHRPSPSSRVGSLAYTGEVDVVTRSWFVHP
ncbi:hypothetical protein [Nonomuraea sp. 10N515B]|uniref:hypothetical protein n=1 Tax=Nonomuraea sp. 10N515B TaxID=3457422 RepID=UPI003FCD78B6